MKDDDGDQNPDDDDAELFRRAVAGARPVEVKFAELPKKRPPPRARFRRLDEAAVLQESLDIDIDDLEASAGERLRFRRPELGERTLRRLARGRYAVQAEIDLHGMTASEAEVALRDFINASLQSHYRCVRVIHGKGLGSGLGGPVLKVRVNRWLRRWREVLAFVSARQVDGGAGAVYVLLRND
ncbi:MAG: Smr/MutS family protein [Woeseia sp.]